MSDVNIDDKIKQVLKQMGISSEYNPAGDLEKFYRLQPKPDRPLKKTLVYDLTPENGSSAQIVPLFDVHAGHKTFAYKAFESYVEYILKTPNTYTVLGGDLHESATKDSVGMSVLEEDEHLAQQREYLEELLEPLAEAGKILVGIQGNHEARVANFNGDCPMRELCRDLGVPYAGYQAYVRVKVGEQKYDLLVFHGAGGGGTKGSKVNAAMKPNQVTIADLYLTGHTHDRTFTDDTIFYMNDKDELVARRRVYVVCGSFLEYFGGYPEMKGLVPAQVGGVRIDLQKEVKRINVYY